MTLTDSTVANNSASGANGGGIDEERTLTVNDCTIASNSAAGDGGGIMIDTTSSMTIADSGLSSTIADDLNPALDGGPVSRPALTT